MLSIAYYQGIYYEDAGETLKVPHESGVQVVFKNRAGFVMTQEANWTSRDSSLLLHEEY